MPRVRISTSVDADRLDRARRLDLGRDSELIDAALTALIDREEQRREIAALEHSPYEADAELRLDDPRVDWDQELPYDGGIPADVIELARRRRANR
jgi:hypothetical protein